MVHAFLRVEEQAEEWHKDMGMDMDSQHKHAHEGEHMDEEHQLRAKLTAKGDAPLEDDGGGAWVKQKHGDGLNVQGRYGSGVMVAGMDASPVEVWM